MKNVSAWIENFQKVLMQKFAEGIREGKGLDEILEALFDMRAESAPRLMEAMIADASGALSERESLQKKSGTECEDTSPAQGDHSRVQDLHLRKDAYGKAEGRCTAPAAECAGDGPHQRLDRGLEE